MGPLDHIRFVLVRPEQGGNVGAAARALKNMGFAELVLVAPCYDDPTEAVRLAHNAEEILAAARHVDALHTALADCRWSVATTRRLGARRTAAHTPRTLAAAVRSDPARRPLAIVYGPQRDGLAAAELDLCHEVLHIPAFPEQPSLNLAQAVLVVAYELSLAHLEAPLPGALGPEATAAELEAQFTQLRQVLLAIGFARPETVEHQMRHLRQLLARARPRPDEVTLLRGLWRQMLWAAARGDDDVADSRHP